MKKIIGLLVVLAAASVFASDFYTADMMAVLRSKAVKSFVAANNLTIVGISYSVGGLCPNGTACPVFYKIDAPNGTANCSFYASVTEGVVTLVSNPSTGKVELDCK
jgi:hypothetical protein